MSNNKNMIDDLDFTHKIRSMPDRELLEFTALQVYDVNQRCPKHDARIAALEDSGAGKDHEKRISKLESQPKTVGALSGGITGGLVGIIFALIEYFKIGR
jgi:hypothetical protein